MGLAGALVLGMVMVATVAAPRLAPFPEDALGTSHVQDRFLPPSGLHWFGTDQLGRDVLTRVAYGGRISLGIGVYSVVTSAVTGTLCGLVAGYSSAWWVDETIMRAADVFLGVPALVLAMLVALMLGARPEMTAVAIAVTWWPRYARVIRSEVVRIKVEEYVLAARCCGVGSLGILRRHVFPGTLPLLAVQASLQMGRALLVAAALGFIGLGPRPPSPEWGLSVAIGRQYLPDSWWMSFFPGMAIVVTVIGLNLLGDGFRVALDPKGEMRL